MILFVSMRISREQLESRGTYTLVGQMCFSLIFVLSDLYHTGRKPNSSN